MKLRARLTLFYAGASAALLVAYACGTFALLRSYEYRTLDQRLHEDVEHFEARLRKEADGTIQLRPAPEAGSEPSDADGELVWLGAVDGERRVVAGKLPEAPASRQQLLAPDVAGEPWASVTLDDGVRIRRLAEPCLELGSGIVLVAARREASVHGRLAAFVWVLGLPLLLGLLLASLGGHLLARRALSPVGTMAARAREITAERLGDRLPVPDPRDELGLLAAAFNDTLARLERAFEQLRRFTADASHELRTPLTALRSVGEVGLREARDPDAYREIIGSMLEEADRLARLVDALLTLARAEAGSVALKLEPLDLADLARAAADSLAVLAEDKDLALGVEATGAAPVRADRLVLRQAVVNLLDNAIKQSPPGARIRLVAGRDDAQAWLDVIDAGPGIAPEHRERIFERFYRVDGGRSAEQGGHGLGLAIARQAVVLHGGRIEVESEPGRGSRFRIALPVDGRRAEDQRS